MSNLRFSSFIVGALFGLVQQAIAQDVLWDNGETDGVGRASNGARTIFEIEIRHMGRKIWSKDRILTLSVCVGGTPGPVKQNTRIDLRR